MKRVLLIIPNLDFGGAQNSFWRLSLLLEPFAEVQLVVFNREALAPQPYAGILHDLEVPASSHWIGKVYQFIRRVSRTREIKRKFNPDVSISFLEGADYVNLLSSTGESVLFYVHGSKVNDLNIHGLPGWLRLNILIPWFYKKADTILVVNDRLADELRSHFGLVKSTFVTIPNSFDFDALYQKSQEVIALPLSSFLEGGPVICLMGRLAPEKGVDRFVRVFQKLNAHRPDARLLVVGDGPEAPAVLRELQHAAIPFARLQDGAVPSNVTWLMAGYHSNPYALLKKCTLLVLPSRNEGLPTSLIEAMCLRVATVAANCPYGPAELLSPGRVPQVWPEIAENGLLCPVLNSPGDEDLWVAALIRMLEDAELRNQLAESGNKYVRKFSPEIITEKWRSLLLTVA